MSIKNILTIFIIPAVVLSLIIFAFFSADSKTNSANISFISSYGWEVNEKCSDISYITIPENFDSVFSAYNNIISKNGYDLTPYKGKSATRYSYTVTNHPDSDSRCVRINIIISKDTIIAADISVLGKDGSVKPLYSPDASH